INTRMIWTPSPGLRRRTFTQFVKRPVDTPRLRHGMIYRKSEDQDVDGASSDLKNILSSESSKPPTIDAALGSVNFELLLRAIHDNGSQERHGTTWIVGSNAWIWRSPGHSAPSAGQSALRFDSTLVQDDADAWAAERIVGPDTLSSRFHCHMASSRRHSAQRGSLGLRSCSHLNKCIGMIRPPIGRCAGRQDRQLLSIVHA
ncbi:unnamed protein product, partial [Mycena citricolor]